MRMNYQAGFDHTYNIRDGILSLPEENFDLSEDMFRRNE